MKSLQNISYKTLFTILFFSLAGIIFFLRIGKPANKVSAAWWDEMWHYRQAINISSHTTAESNVYIITTVNIGSTIKAQVDDGDFRFTDYNGNLLPYYISANAGTTAPTFHVQFTTFPAGAQTIYVYYGNPSATNGFSTSAFSTHASNYTIGSLSTEELSPAPIAYWKFDEGVGTTAYDSAGNNNGTLSGTTLPEWQNEDQCVSGKCLNFQGLSSTHNSTLTNNLSNIVSSSTSFTMTAWINLHGPPTNYCGVIISAGNWNTDNGYWKFGIHYAGGVYTGPQLGYGNAADMSYVFQLNKWYFLTWTSNNGTNYFYVDGKYIGSSVDSAYSTTTIPKIGQASYGNYFNFNGLIDDLKIYNYIRTADQIKQDYNSRGSMSGSSVNLGVRSNTAPSIKSSLIAHYRFDEGNGTTTYNSGNGGTAINGIFGTGDSAPSWTNEGKNGKALSFDGVNDYLMSNNIVNLYGSTTNGSTVSLWVKYLNSNYIFAVDGWYNRLFDGQWTITDANNNYYYLSLGNIGDGNWHHVVYTLSGRTLKAYKDGNLTNTTTTSSDVPTRTGTMWLGNVCSGSSCSYFFNGLIDEVKIYNTALTDEEIKQDYNGGSAIQFGSTSQSVGGTTTSLEYCIPGDTSYCVPPIAEWKMDEGVGTSIVDTSGNNNTGTLINSPLWIQGKIGKGINFNGSNKRITISNPITSSGYSTVSLWYKRSESDSSTSWRTLIGHATANIHHLILNNTTRNIGIWDGGWRDFGYNPPDDNKWHHYEVIYNNGTNATLYVDGNYKNQITTTLNLSTNPIGSIGNYGGSSYWAGPIDHVKIYNYARTPAQIAYDYNRGAPIGHWKLDECQGDVAYDWSGNANHGTINIGSGGSQNSLGTCGIGTSAAWTNGAVGKVNSSLSFDGVDDYLQINEIGTTGNTPISLSLWANFRSNSSGDDVFIIYGKDGTTYQCAGLYLRSSDNYVRFTGWSGSTVDYSTGFIKDYNVWHHWILVYNGSTVLIYRDGIPDPVGSQSKSLNFTLKKLLIGGGAASGNYTDTKIDDVRIYNYPLTPEQIKQVYNGGAVNFR